MSQDPKAVGLQIRALLLSLKHSDDTLGSPWQHYGTDDLRRQALEHAGICWLAPGEMAPACACEWSEEHPEGAREALQRRLSGKK